MRSNLVLNAILPLFKYLGPAGAMHAATVFLTNGGEVIVRMRGLPFDAKVTDIVS